MLNRLYNFIGGYKRGQLLRGIRSRAKVSGDDWSMLAYFIGEAEQGSEWRPYYDGDMWEEVEELLGVKRRRDAFLVVRLTHKTKLPDLWLTVEVREGKPIPTSLRFQY